MDIIRGLFSLSKLPRSSLTSSDLGFGTESSGDEGCPDDLDGYYSGDETKNVQEGPQMIRMKFYNVWEPFRIHEDFIEVFMMSYLCNILSHSNYLQISKFCDIGGAAQKIYSKKEDQAGVMILTVDRVNRESWSDAQGSSRGNLCGLFDAEKYKREIREGEKQVRGDDTGELGDLSGSVWFWPGEMIILTDFYLRDSTFNLEYTSITTPLFHTSFKLCVTLVLFHFILNINSLVYYVYKSDSRHLLPEDFLQWLGLSTESAVVEFSHAQAPLKLSQKRLINACIVSHQEINIIY
ncbi:hypothetical protein VP01_3084g2 [Puccinia sorghi]|uniref:Uncharacterized protein n=1 Tax=Puccinia sorghi TaxID=27349 RepID=A0A0L6V1G9_9BASI|nr:hypothetical protein VP01_3084g2 [Puccinia sorghi]